MTKSTEFLLDVWAVDKQGNKVHPYKGQSGPKKGLYSVNFTSDNKKFIGLTEGELIKAIELGRFKERGRIRMMTTNYKPGAERNAFAPIKYKDDLVKSFR
jgi:hypothetical protein